MPWVTINILAGTSVEKKKKLHTEVATAIQNALDIPLEHVRIHLVEMADDDHSIGGIGIREILNQ
ncbi:MAG TPA: tautomerase family protein [Alphaproteobacteria bacterium]